MAPAQGSRLDSWKGIAEYLGRNVRTVTRWADERGLPVHRIPGGTRGRVFAFPDEIDAWLLDQKHAPSSVATAAAPSPEVLLSAPTNGSPSRQAATARSSFNPSPYRRMIVIAGCLLAAAIGVSFVFRSGSTAAARIFSIRYEGDTLRATAAGGRTLWTRRYANASFENYFATHPNTSPPVRIADYFHDGNKEAAAVVPLHLGPNQNQVTHSEVDFFSGEGDLLWRYAPEESFRFGTHELTGPWIFMDLFVSQSSTGTSLWATAGQHTWGNSFVSQIDPRTGHGTVRFVNTGILYCLNELKTSSRRFLLAGGFNNEWDSGSLAIIAENRPFAASPQTPGTRHYCNSCPPGPPDYYFVFPRSEINRISRIYEDPIVSVDIGGGGH